MYDAALEYLQTRTRRRPRVAVVLGSGLGGFAEELAESAEIPYAEIPNWPQSTAQGHAGKLVFGKLGSLEVAVMSGRAHLYEGYTPAQVAFGVRVLGRLGVRAMVFTNAAGGLNPRPARQASTFFHGTCADPSAAGRHLHLETIPPPACSGPAASPPAARSSTGFCLRFRQPSAIFCQAPPRSASRNARASPSPSRAGRALRQRMNVSCAVRRRAQLHLQPLAHLRPVRSQQLALVALQHRLGRAHDVPAALLLEERDVVLADHAPVHHPDPIGLAVARLHRPRRSPPPSSRPRGCRRTPRSPAACRSG